MTTIEEIFDKYSVYEEGFAKTLTFKEFQQAAEELLNLQQQACENAYHNRCIEVESPYYHSVGNAILNAKLESDNA